MGIDAISALANMRMGCCLNVFIIIGISIYEIWLNTNITGCVALGAWYILVCFIPQQNNTTSAHNLQMLYIILPPRILPIKDESKKNGNSKSMTIINIAMAYAVKRNLLIFFICV